MAVRDVTYLLWGDINTGMNSFCANKELNSYQLQLFNLFSLLIIPGIMDIPLPLSKLALHLINHDDK